MLCLSWQCLQLAPHAFHSVIDGPNVLAEVGQHAFFLKLDESNFVFDHQAIEHLS